MQKGGVTIRASQETLLTQLGMTEDCRILGIDYNAKSDVFEIHVLTGKGNFEKIPALGCEFESCWTYEGGPWNVSAPHQKPVDPPIPHGARGGQG